MPACKYNPPFLALFIFLAWMLLPPPLAEAFASQSWEEERALVASLAEAVNLSEVRGDLDEARATEDQALLKQFEPRVFVAPGGEAPIDFYRDYLPRTTIRRMKDNAMVEENLSRERLRANVLRTDIYLDYKGPAQLDGGSVVYGQVARETVNLSEEGKFKPYLLTFLHYHFVFLHEGLPARIKAWKERIVGYFIDPQKWRSPSVHNAFIVVLDEWYEVRAIMFSRYGQYRTLLRDVDFTMASGSPIALSFSKRSNAPYLLPEAEDPIVRRVALDPKDIDFVLMGGSDPLFGGVDLIYSVLGGAREVAYRLEFLHAEDPLSVARFPLGPFPRFPWKGEIPYRRAPVGMIFHTCVSFARWRRLILIRFC